MPRGVVATAGAVLVATAVAPAAAAQTHASIHASLRPDRPGAMAALRLTIHYEDSESAVPAQLRRAVLRLPEALGVEVPRLRSCSTATLRARGPSGCAPPSRIGSGSAIAETHAGSQTLRERVQLTAFLGPLVGLQPTFEIFAQGVTPFQQRVVLAGAVVPDSPPYGEDLAISIPPIATLPLEPAASIASLSLSIGSAQSPRSRGANGVVVPSNCPRGGLPFAVQSSFLDGSSSAAVATIPCP